MYVTENKTVQSFAPPPEALPGLSHNLKIDFFLDFFNFHGCFEIDVKATSMEEKS